MINSNRFMNFTCSDNISDYKEKAGNPGNPAWNGGEGRWTLKKGWWVNFTFLGERRGEVTTQQREKSFFTVEKNLSSPSNAISCFFLSLSRFPNFLLFFFSSAKVWVFFGKRRIRCLPANFFFVFFLPFLFSSSPLLKDLPRNHFWHLLQLTPTFQVSKTSN